MFSKPQFTAQEIADLDRAYQNAIYEVYDRETARCGGYLRYSDCRFEHYMRLKPLFAPGSRRGCGQTIQLFIDRPNSELDSILKQYNCTGWSLITAFNPYSQHLSPAENQKRHQSLIEFVQQLNLTFVDAVGKDRDGTWTPEQSIFIVGIELEKAIAIGKKFQQNAIVFGELGKESKLIWL